MLGDRAEAKVGYTVRFRLVRDQLRLVHDRFGTTGYWSAVRDDVVTCFSSNVAFSVFDQSTPCGFGRWL